MVTWVDAAAYTNWISDKEAQEFIDKDIIVDTVGFLVVKTKKYLVLAQTICPQLSNIMKIPIGMIKTVEKIKRSR